MRIRTETCSYHSQMAVSLNDHEAHAYRQFKIGAARRCPKSTFMTDFLRDHPSVEVQTLRELQRIRELLEQDQLSLDLR